MKVSQKFPFTIGIIFAGENYLTHECTSAVSFVTVRKQDIIYVVEYAGVDGFKHADLKNEGDDAKA